MRNEKGYALVLVLLIITLTFTFALSMSGMALNTRKQINKTDDLNVATDLAEMGVAHYQSLVENQVEIANNIAREKVNEALQDLGKSNKKDFYPPDYDKEFKSALNIEILTNPNISLIVEDNNEYEIISSEVDIDTSKITVAFKSQGNIHTEQKILDSTIFISKTTSSSRAGEPAPAKSDFDYVEMDAIDFKGNGQDKDLVYNSSTFFDKSITIRGNRIIAVNGDAFFNQLVYFAGGADIIVYGDAIFTKEYEEMLNNNSAYSFCVTGNTYYIEDGKLAPYNPFPSGNTASCPKGDSDGWHIDPINGIDVTY